MGRATLKMIAAHRDATPAELESAAGRGRGRAKSDASLGADMQAAMVAKQMKHITALLLKQPKAVPLCLHALESGFGFWGGWFGCVGFVYMRGQLSC